MAKLHRDNAGYIGCSHEETQDPYYSYNKLSVPLSGATETVKRPAEVTHTVTVAGGKFVIGGVSQATLSLIEGGTYKFDQSDSSNGTHPFKFSQTSNGTWNRGTEYTKGVSYVGTPGTSGAYTQLVVPFGGLDLYYYCGNHTGMGGSAKTPANAGMFTVGLPILKTTDQFGASAPTGGSAVNVVGDPTSSTDNPFGSGNGHSVEFDGNDALRIQGGAIGTGDWTIEFWVKSGSYGLERIVSANQDTYGSERTNLRTWNGDWEFYAGDNPGTQSYSGTTISVNTWVHAAVCRNGTTIEYFANGSRIATDTIGASVTTTLTEVDVAHGYGSEYFTGKISNVRVSNTYRYSGSTYTIPTAGFTSDANTLLLAAHTSSITTAQGTWSSGVWPGTEDTAPDPYAANLVLAVPMNGSNNGTTFADQSAAIRGSGSASNITRAGSTTHTGEFNYYGSSGSFDGVDDSLTVDYNSNYFDPGSDDYTVEAWVKWNSGQAGHIMSWHGGGISSRWDLGCLNAGALRFFIRNGTSYSINISVATGTWLHVAAQRRGNHMELFVNGSLKGSTLMSGVWPAASSTGPIIGKRNPSTGNFDYMNGYIQDLRIYKGVAKYQPEGSGSLGMDVVTYYGTGSSQPISNFSFKPDFVWIKSLGPANRSHMLFDSVRGQQRRLISHEDVAEDNDSSTLTAFNSNGFTVHTRAEVNFNGESYVAWGWKAGGAATTIATNSLTNTAYERSQNWTNLMTFNAGTWNGNGINPFNLDGSDNDYGNVTRSNGGYATLDISSLTGSRVISVTSQQTEVTITHDGGTTTFTPPHTSQITHTFDAVTNPTSIKFIGLNGGSYFVLVGVSVDGKRLINSNISAPTVPSIASTVSANDDYGFSIVKYNSGNTTGNYTLAHSLSSVPKFIIHKQLSTGNWWVYHESAINDLHKYLQLNSQNGVQTNSGAMWGSAFPDSSTFGIRVGDTIGTSTDAVAYCWSEIPGFSKFASYSGNSSVNYIQTGFKVKYVLIKRSNGTTDWIVFDSQRGTQGLYPNNANKDDWSAYAPVFGNDGFTLPQDHASLNETGGTYIYAAFADSAPGDPGQDAFKILDTLNTKDQSSSAHTVTNNGASFQTGIQKFYDGAAEFNGSSSSLTIPGSAELAMGTGDFTYEMFIHQNNYATRSTFFDNRSASSITGITVGTEQNNGQIRVYMNASSGGDITVTGPTMPLGQWVHIAVCRNGGTVTLFVDGYPSASGTRTSDLNNPSHNIVFGYTSRPGATSYSYLDGYMQDIRVYKGIAKYTSSFSPPERSIQGTARRYPSGVYVVS